MSPSSFHDVGFFCPPRILKRRTRFSYQAFSPKSSSFRCPTEGGAAGAIGVYAATRRVRPALATAAAVALAWGGAKVVKNVVERGRPAELLGDVEVRESGIHGQG